VKAFLGLGSNLGDRFNNLSEAIRRLDIVDGIEVGDISAVYETDPLGDPSQPKYLNAAIGVETTLEPKKLLKSCMTVERNMGRVRHERWESRVIDIDILFYDDLVMSTIELTLPHPLLHEREFVLRPLADIAPNLVHPMLDESIRELLEKVEPSGVERVNDRSLTP
jgi:2-amino-4-hydroxy-6-hydroxymethyldihydropteridine diphosphokinase